MSTRIGLGAFTLAILSLLLISGLSPALQPLEAQPGVVVESADPPTGEQDTPSLDVTISGKGFKEGSTASFLVTGSPNPGGIIVNNTRFVNARTLVSNVTIESGALLGGFDIEVLSGGRRGKGIDLFKVVEKDNNGNSGPGDPQDPAVNPPADVWINDELISSDGKSARLTSDVGGSSGLGGEWYLDGQAGVYALINNSSCDDPTASACNDGIFDPDLHAKKRDLRSGKARQVRIVLDDPVEGDCTENGGDVYCDAFSHGTFLNVDGLARVGSELPSPSTRDAILHLPGATLFFSPLVEVIGAAGGDPCAWRVSLDADNPGGDAAEYRVSSGSQGEWILIDSYHFPFEIEFWVQDIPVCQ